MHFSYHQNIQQFICIVFIFITPIICQPTRETLLNIRCTLLRQNCTFPPENSTSLVNSTDQLQTLKKPSLVQVITSRPARQTTSKLKSTTYRPSTTTKRRPSNGFDSFSDNLKRAALILAAIAIGLGILRICLMLCKSRSPNNSPSTRRSATVRPELATVEQHPYKPDLPPAYAEAIRSKQNDGWKLPSYDELPYEQRQHSQQTSNDDDDNCTSTRV